MGYFIVSVIAACVMVGLAFYAYPEEAPKALRGAYKETKHLIGTIARRGWRPLLPWLFIFVAGGIGARVVFGLPLTIDVVQLAGVLGPLVIPTLLGQWTRSIETRAGVANGLVNPASLA